MIRRGVFRIGELPLLLTFVLVDGITLVSDTRWIGEWNWTVEWLNGGLYLAGGALCAISTFIAIPYLKSGSTALFGAHRFRPALRLLLLVQMKPILIGLIGHGVILGIGLSVTASTHPTGTLSAGGFMYAVLPILFFSALGTVLAVYLPSLTGVVLSFAVAYILGYLAATLTISLPIVVGGTYVSMVGLKYEGLTLGASAVTTVALALSLTLLGSVLLVMRERPWGRTLGTSALVLLLVVPTILDLRYDEPVVESAESVPLVCDHGEPNVCVLEGHTRNLPLVSAKLRDAYNVMEVSGVERPITVSEKPAAGGVSSGTQQLALNASELNRANFSDSEYVESVVGVDHCLSQSVTSDDSAWGSNTHSVPRDLLDIQYYLVGWGVAALGGIPEPGNDLISHLDKAWARSAVSALVTCVPDPAILAAVTSAK